MNHERNGKLLTGIGQAVLTRSDGGAGNGGNQPIRPDGGVVTQRTANPLPRAENRHSLHFPPRLSRIGPRGEICSPANSAQGMPSEGPRREGGSGASAPASPVRRMRPHPVTPQEKM
jgi:hypothetical protein